MLRTIEFLFELFQAAQIIDLLDQRCGVVEKARDDHALKFVTVILRLQYSESVIICSDKLCQTALLDRLDKYFFVYYSICLD